MGCGSCGGGGVSYTSLVSGGGVPAGGGQQPATMWRVSYIENGVQTSKDWATDIEAFAHAGAVGGTLSQVSTR